MGLRLREVHSFCPQGRPHTHLLVAYHSMYMHRHMDMHMHMHMHMHM